MIAAGPGFLGYGASLLWTGPKKNAAPLYAIAVTPGNITVRRNSDQLVTAHVTGMKPDKAQLFAHYQSAAGWEPVTMQAAPDSAAARATSLFSPACRRTSSTTWRPGRSFRRTTRCAWSICRR